MDDKYKLPAMWSAVIAGGMLILAIGDWEYYYYEILRLVVFASSCILWYYFASIQKKGWGWLFISSAILFNPLIPFNLERETWQLLDVGYAVAFFSSLSALDSK